MRAYQVTTELRVTCVVKDDECIQRLMELGLSLLQARIYLGLVALEKSEIVAISKASNVARTDVYRIIPTLEKLGLAEKLISKPTMYKATPLKDGLSMLLQRKRKAYAVLENNTIMLLNSFPDDSLQASKEVTSHFIITSEKTLFQKRFEKSFSQAQTAEIVLPKEGFRLSPYPIFDYIKAASKRGARIRMITNRVENDPMDKKTERLRKNSFFEVKFAAAPLKFATAVFDKKDLNICVSPDGTDVPSLYTDNVRIVEMANLLFEAMWNSADEK